MDKIFRVVRFFFGSNTVDEILKDFHKVITNLENYEDSIDKEVKGHLSAIEDHTKMMEQKNVELGRAGDIKEKIKSLVGRT